MPAFAISLGVITNEILQNRFILKNCILYTPLLLTPVIYLIQDDRNGVLYVLLLMIVCTVMLVHSVLNQVSRNKNVMLIAIIAIIIFIGSTSYFQNPKWKMFLADSKVAVQIEKYQNWKFQLQLNHEYPINEYGVTVSPSNYERMAWGLAGLRLLVDHPYGYGLMSLSFGKLSKAKWPDSFLSMTHSGWLDFAIGYGIIGVSLLSLSAFLTWRHSKKITDPWNAIGRWGLGALGLVMITTEVSSEIFINGLIFILLMTAGMTFKLKRVPSKF